MNGGQEITGILKLAVTPAVQMATILCSVEMKSKVSQPNKLAYGYNHFLKINMELISSFLFRQHIYFYLSYCMGVSKLPCNIWAQI